MARVVSSPLGLHRFRPHPIRFHQIQQVRRSSINPQKKICRYQQVKIYCCQSTPNPTESSSSTQVNTIFSSSTTFSKLKAKFSYAYPCSVRGDEVLFEWIYFLVSTRCDVLHSFTFLHRVHFEFPATDFRF